MINYKVDKLDLVQLIVNSYPHYKVWDTLIEKKVADFYSDKLEWRFDILTNTFDEHLVEILEICKNSYK